MDDGVLLLRGILPLSIKILADKRASCVAQNDTVRINHGHDLEDKVISQNSCTDRRSHEVVDDTFHHVGGSGFTRMHPRADDDTFLIFHLLLVIREGRDGQQIAGISGVRLAQHLPSESVLSLWVLFELCKVSLKIRVGVWVTMRKVDGIAIMVKLDAEGQRVVVTAWLLLLDRILVVANVLADSLPASSGEHRFLVGVHQRLHTVVVQTIGLQEVDDVEPIGTASTRILKAEIEPLVVDLSIIIWLQN